MRDPRPLEEQGLGSDPFTQGDGTLPFLLKLRERTVRLVGEPTQAGSASGEPAPGDPARRAEARERPAHAPPDLGPPVPELPIDDGDEIASWLDRAAGVLLSDRDEERALRVLGQLGARSYDPLGFCPRTARRALAVFKQIYQHWFRVESSGHEHIPEKGGALIAANHGGVLPFDGAMAIVDGFLHASPPRLMRAIVDRWAGSLPFVNVFYARVGQVIGTRENFRALLRSGQLVLVFPEGMSGIRKLAAERYVLQTFHVGFVEESIRHRAPIVPMAIVGADDQAPVLYDIKPLAKLLGLPLFPITPTFPLLGPLGLLPYPVKYEIVYGEPFRFYEEFPDDVASDPHAVRYMAQQVKRRIQELVDRRVLARRGRA